jgi:hypothetical protein
MNVISTETINTIVIEYWPAIDTVLVVVDMVVELLHATIGFLVWHGNVLMDSPNDDLSMFYDVMKRHYDQSSNSTLQAAVMCTQTNGRRIRIWINSYQTTMAIINILL